MSLFKGFVMSLGMFSIIPVPKNSWNDKYMPMIIPNLPLVGALIGIIWYGSASVMLMLSAPLMMHSAILLFIPFILNGFIHADGFMDTVDAVFSRKNIDEKKRILKDPHVGSFAVIAVVGLIILQFSAVYTIVDTQKGLLIFVFIPVISRCIVGIAMLNLKPAFETGYNTLFRNNTKPRHTVLICLIMLICLSVVWFWIGIMGMPLLAEAVVGIIATLYLYNHFQGMSGDLCGCIITVSEFAALFFMAIL